MTALKYFGLVTVICLTGCAPLARQVGTDVAPQISTDVAAQVSTQVVELPPTSLATISATEAPYDCEEKTCAEMTSCEEAVYKLDVCGHSSRDKDGDGVPCESLCTQAEVDATASQSRLRTEDPAIESKEEIGPVTRVVDGDTIHVLLDGENVSVRYLQVNTPERDEPCYRQATQANADLVAGKTVRLVPDVELVDRYDRLLRFIYVDDVLVNRVLVEQGFAEVVLYPPNDKHYDEFVRLEAQAAAAGRGCHPTGIFADGSSTR